MTHLCKIANPVSDDLLVITAMGVSARCSLKAWFWRVRGHVSDVNN